LVWMMSAAWTTPADTLLVGDSTIDATTARAAGARFCLAAYGFGQQFTPMPLRDHDERADHPSALPRVFERVWG
jgi:phosphoglycolate phosphatase-like HAD superfamily hydrolase